MKIASMQVEKNEVQTVEKGKTAAVKTTDKARKDDTVYKVKE
jgi:hypothetical protein